MNKLIVLSLAMAVAANASAIPGVIRTATDPRKGDIKWQSRSKSYSLTYKKGKTDVSAEYPIDDVVELQIEKPAGFDKAVENVKRGNGAAAIGILVFIVCATISLIVYNNSKSMKDEEAFS